MWTAAYLPAWSSTAEAAATYAVDDGLRLSIPPDQGLWCPDLHDGALRVSAVEDEPERCGEICLVEVFGDALTTGDDGRPIKVVNQAPDYPMQLVIGVFDFPDRPPVASAPELVVSHVIGSG